MLHYTTYAQGDANRQSIFSGQKRKQMGGKKARTLRRNRTTNQWKITTEIIKSQVWSKRVLTQIMAHIQPSTDGYIMCFCSTKTPLDKSDSQQHLASIAHPSIFFFQKWLSAKVAHLWGTEGLNTVNSPRRWWFQCIHFPSAWSSAVSQSSGVDCCDPARRFCSKFLLRKKKKPRQI